MATRIVFNGREVTNLAAKAAISAVAVLLSELISAGVIFLVLPFVGIALTLSAGFLFVAFIALGVGSPLFLLGGSVIGALLTSIAVFIEGKKNKKLR